MYLNLFITFIEQVKCKKFKSNTALSFSERLGIYNRGMKRMKLFQATAVIILTAFILYACTPSPPPVSVAPEVVTEAQAVAPVAEPTLTLEAAPEEETRIASGWEVEVVAGGLYIPWSVVFPSKERILVSERNGAIREVKNGELNPFSLYVFDEVASQEEAGLMGIALHPQYEENRYVYACYASAVGGEIIDKVVRLVDEGDALTIDRVIVDDIPAARYHAGCRIKFGPDGMLYITTGDALQKEQAQNLDSLAGKILRVDVEGNIPTDNPFSGSAVYSYGHRNPQGIDWDPESGQLFSTEHGPSGFDGPGGGDEINLIEAGGNYGWPLVSHDDVMEGTIAPLIQYTPAEAPASALYYTSEVMPFFSGSLFFGALRGEGVVRVVLTEDESGNITVEQTEKIINNVGRVRDVVEGPDGSIYFTTSNRDGRGQEREGDDRLYRIYPVYD
jgi:glucose/arabinose dehydrogenase